MAKLIVAERPAALRCAVYSRFSTDRQNECSVADQVRVCTDYAATRGWTIVELFTDQGISGAALGNRPGMQAALSAATSAKFDVLLVRDVQRVARGEDLPVLAKRLKFHGIRLVGVLDGTDSQAEGSRMRFGMEGILGAEYLDSVRRLTHSGLTMRAKQGNHTGGAAYGYATVPDGRYFRRVVHEEQATILREIFTRYAAGESMKAIASDLNGRGIPSPGAGWTRTTRRGDGCWLVSALHAILRNEIYIGRSVWNRREFRKDPDSGKRVAIERPPSEWIVRDVPELRLIDAETWQRVRARDVTGFRSSNARPKYVLSGLLYCAECGRAMTLVGGRGQRYVCATNHAGGDAACPNRLGVARTLAEDMLLAPVQDRLLSDSAVQRTVQELRDIAAGRVKRPARTMKDPRVAEMRRLVAAGIMTEAEARPALERIESARRAAPAFDFERAARSVETRAAELREAIKGKAVSVARDALRRLVGTVRLKRTANAGGDYLTAYFERDAQSLPLLDWLSIDGRDWESALVAGAGFEPATFGL